jgi:adenylylsulfate kinase
LSAVTKHLRGGAGTPPNRDSSGFTIWFTGLSGSGKSTVAGLLEGALRDRGHRVEVLDGDVVRTNLTSDLGFTREDRDANVRRVGWVCELLSRNDVIAIAALISPYRAARDEVRARIGRFVEVHMDASIEVVEARDVKGLYAKARAGEIDRFTGLTDGYEPPTEPEVVCRSDGGDTPEACVRRIVERASELGYLPAESAVTREPSSGSP